MIYIASPYSVDDPLIRHERYLHACRFVDLLISDGFVAFSPIVYGHPIAERLRYATDAEAWLHFNLAFLRKSEAMYVLQLAGWKLSKGVQIELNISKMLGIPTVHYSPNFDLLSEECRGRVWERQPCAS